MVSSFLSEKSGYIVEKDQDHHHQQEDDAGCRDIAFLFCRDLLSPDSLDQKKEEPASVQGRRLITPRLTVSRVAKLIKLKITAESP